MSSLLGIRNGIPFLQNIAGIGAPYDQSTTLVADLSGPFTLPNGQTYNIGQGELLVIIDGIVQVSGMDYTETSTTQITLQKVVKAGQTIRVRR